jgi:hypothetical protein
MFFNFRKPVLFFTLYILTDRLLRYFAWIRLNEWGKVYVKSTLNNLTLGYEHKTE